MTHVSVCYIIGAEKEVDSILGNHKRRVCNHLEADDIIEVVCGGIKV